MTATIQKILKPTKYRAVDTSGNNNHGQIYSGRALEFDGVSDYLSVSSEMASTVFGGYLKTFACWVKFDNVATEQVIAAGWLSSQSIGIKDSELATCAINGNDDISTKTKLISNTWYRIVVVSNVDTSDASAVTAAYDNGLSHFDFYINGQLQEKEAANFYRGAGDMLLGARLYSSEFSLHFAGKMSDVQGWDTAWSASDALYDYLNPESLALNNSGTLLTESNLKLWYPMQDGHRGQQSYIMDGANTGLGPNLISNGDFETSGSWQASNTELTGGGSTSGTTIPDDGVGLANSDETIKYTTDKFYTGSRSMYIKTVPHGNEGLRQSFAVVEGVTYKFSAWFWCADGKQALIANANNEFQDNLTVKTSNSIDSEWQYVEMYATCDNVGSGTSYIYIWADTGTNEGEFYVDDVKVEPINNKHHGTTGFLGDELNTQANAVTPEHSSASEANDTANWTNSGMTNFGSSTDNETQGTYSLRMTCNSNSDLAHTNFTNTVIGRTYRMQWDRRITNHAVQSLIVFKVGESADENTNGEVNSWASNNATTSVTGEYLDFIATATTTFFTCSEHGDDNDADLYLDNLSLREIGTASGWTDADQQLDIPQTALQSYNQLAWFNSETNDSTEDSIGFTDGSSDLNFQATDWSASFWLYVFDDNTAGDANSGGYVMSKGYYNNSGWYIFCEAGGYLRLYTPQSGDNDYAQSLVIPKGRWAHCVATVGSSGTSAKWYVNGELGTTTTIDAATSNTDNFNLMNRLAATNALGGSINEVSMWNKTLTQSEINELYNDGKALDAQIHSAKTNLLHYWRNNGLGIWKDLGNATSLYDGTPNQITETLLLPAGVDSSRDNQGFLMNRQKDTNSLNLKTSEGLLVSSDNGPDAVIIEDGSSFDHSDGTDSKFSVSLWFKANDYGSLPQDQVIMSKGTNNDGKREWKIILNDNSTTQLRLEGSSAVGNGGTGNDLGYTLANITDTNWHHIVVTYDGTEIAGNEVVAYLDGGSALLRSDGDAEIKINADDGNVCIGDVLLTNTGGDGFEFDGQIDDVCYYNRKILSATEAKRNYNAGKRSHK